MFSVNLRRRALQQQDTTTLRTHRHTNKSRHTRHKQPSILRLPLLLFVQHAKPLRVVMAEIHQLFLVRAAVETKRNQARQEVRTKWARARRGGGRGCSGGLSRKLLSGELTVLLLHPSVYTKLSVVFCFCVNSWCCNEIC